VSAPLESTNHRGIYRRRGERGVRYVVSYRAEGRQKRETVRTLREALRVKRAREADRDRGDYHEESREKFRDFAAGWIERYRGKGRNGLTENTRAEYRRDLERYAYPFLGDMRLSSIRPRDVSEWVEWLIRRPIGLSDASVRRILAPVRSCLATARRENLIRHNPADDTPLPHRPRVEETDDDGEVRALTRGQLDAVLRVVHPDHRTMLRFLAATGLRWSELVGLRRGDLRLDGSRPCVRVRRALVQRRGRGVGEAAFVEKPPKSRHGRRDVPLDYGLVLELRAHLRGLPEGGDEDLAFPNREGRPLDQANVRRRVLRPAAEEAGVPWCGFHTFRHTCASLLFAQGRNAKQVQRWLGHHSPSFTLDVYGHLLDEGVGEGLDLDAELPGPAREPEAAARQLEADSASLGG
jgi:integrase